MQGLWLNLGCGDNRLPAPWQNYDAELDVTKRLPFEDGSVQYILIEHCCEHQTCSEVFKFFEEAHRILQPGGVLRVAVPDIERINDILQRYDMVPYLTWLVESGFGKPTWDNAIRNIVVNHGHKSMWTQNLLRISLTAAGFIRTQVCECGKSIHAELCNIEGHHKVIGLHPAWVETTVIEAVK